ncbi:MAG: early E1A protein [Lachnospiraceae bacterium]
MQASGNGLPMQCVANLVRIVRGECTYDRIKGIDPSLLDRPETIAGPLLIADARWLIKTYEPRVNVNQIHLKDLLAREGNFKFDINAVVKG